MLDWRAGRSSSGDDSRFDERRTGEERVPTYRKGDPRCGFVGKPLRGGLARFVHRVEQANCMGSCSVVRYRVRLGLECWNACWENGSLRCCPPHESSGEQKERESDLIDTSSSWTASFFHWRVWLCFILQLTNYTGWTSPGCASPWLATGPSWNATLSPSSSFTSPSRTEWILRGLWDAHRCFTSSHQDQWWLSCACALHFLARWRFHSDDVVMNQF